MREVMVVRYPAIGTNQGLVERFKGQAEELGFDVLVLPYYAGGEAAVPEVNFFIRLRKEGGGSDGQ